MGLRKKAEREEEKDVYGLWDEGDGEEEEEEADGCCCC